MEVRNHQEVREIRKEDLREIFNRASESVRLVALLSPRCPMCQQGHDVVKALFTHFTSSRLRGIRVWLPMYPGDARNVAEAEAAAFRDSRLVDGWDPQRSIGELFARTLGLTKTAWDVYLLYGPGVRWEGEEPPEPTFWMHQLGPSYGANPRRFLDPDILDRKLGAILPADEEWMDGGSEHGDRGLANACCSGVQPRAVRYSAEEGGPR